MTTTDTFAQNPPSGARFRLPDIPERHPDEKMTAFDSLHELGNPHHLIQYLGNPETTLVGADRWIIAAPGTFRELARYPDLLVAFDVNPAAYKASNGYIITEQGKPPDFVLEVASASTGNIDVSDKRDDYAALGIGEYWRFDETGEHHGARLAGDVLADGTYQPVEIVEIAAGVYQGYSAPLHLLLRWDAGRLRWIDPATGRHIPTFESERAARLAAEAELRRLRGS